jgi:hypothetical protein
MLGDEDRMIVPGRLLAIIRRESRRQSFFNKPGSMLEHIIHAFSLEIIEFLLL